MYTSTYYIHIYIYIHIHAIFDLVARPKGFSFKLWLGQTHYRGQIHPYFFVLHACSHVCLQQFLFICRIISMRNRCTIYNNQEAKQHRCGIWPCSFHDFAIFSHIFPIFSHIFPYFPICWPHVGHIVGSPDPVDTKEWTAAGHCTQGRRVASEGQCCGLFH